jgi:hypothetical protein
VIIGFTNQLVDCAAQTLVIVPNQGAQGLKLLVSESWRHVTLLPMGQNREKQTLHEFVVVQVVGRHKFLENIHGLEPFHLLFNQILVFDEILTHALKKLTWNKNLLSRGLWASQNTCCHRAAAFKSGPSACPRWY